MPGSGSLYLQVPVAIDSDSFDVTVTCDPGGCPLSGEGVPSLGGSAGDADQMTMPSRESQRVGEKEGIASGVRGGLPEVQKERKGRFSPVR